MSIQSTKHLIFIIVILLCFLFSQEFNTENGIVILNKNNLQEVINKHQYILIYYYTNTPESLKILEAYEKTYKIIKNYTIPLVAKYQITSKDEMIDLKIGKVPIFSMTTNEKRSDFNLNNEGEILFFFHKAFKLIINLESKSILDSFIEDEKPEYTIYLLYIGNDIKNKVKNGGYEKFDILTKEIKDILFITCSSIDCIDLYGNQSLMLIKNFKPNENKENILKSIEKLENEEIKEWVISNSLGYVMNFNDIFIDNGIMKKGLAFIIFRSETSNKKKEYVKVLTKLSKKFPEFSFYSSDISGSEELEKLSRYFKVTDNQLPIGKLYDIRTGDLHEYVFDHKEFLYKDIKSFIDEFYLGHVKRIILSQSLEEANENQSKLADLIKDKVSYVKPLVRNTFSDEVLHNSKDVIVNFYTDWCQTCHEFMPFYEKLALFMKTNPDLVFTKIDMSKNTVDGTKVTEYPTFKLYPGLDKSSPIDYNGNAVYAELSEFIKKHSNSTIHIPQEVYDMKDDL